MWLQQQQVAACMINKCTHEPTAAAGGRRRSCPCDAAAKMVSADLATAQWVEAPPVAPSDGEAAAEGANHDEATPEMVIVKGETAPPPPRPPPCEDIPDAVAAAAATFFFPTAVRGPSRW